MSLPFDLGQIRAVLLDIEGTTTPADFVYEVLFPFARVRVLEFLKERWNDVQVRADFEALRVEYASDENRNLEPPVWNAESREEEIRSVAAYVHWLMDRDRKSAPLKSLQGQIWQKGYANGLLHGIVYSDVPAALARWRQQGRNVYIFSSGSVLAQKLLFANSTAGDLSIFIQSYFDTKVGRKQEAQSYRRIVRELAMDPLAVVFVSDVVAELDAAREAGMATVLCVRGELQGHPASSHASIRSFDELLP